MRTKIRRKQSGSRVRWYLSSIDASGKEHAEGGYSTRTEAKVAAASLTTDAAAGRHRTPTKLTVSAFLEREWLPSREQKIAPSTLEAYAWAISAWIAPGIGDIPLQRLATDDLERLYSELRAHGGRGGAPLAPKTVRNAHLVVSKALGLAVRRGYIAANPAALVEWGEQERRTEREAWTITEARTFLATASGDRLYAVWRLMLATGIRRGEALGATWDAIDLDARTLVVRQQVLLRGRSTTAAPRLYLRATTKGRRPRTVTFDEGTQAALRAWRAQQGTERLAFGPAWHTDGGLDLEAPWLVTEPNGLVIHPDTLHDRFVRLVKAVGVRRLVLHGTRHSFATIALAEGVRPDVVSRALGHASTGFTLDRYVHPGDKERTEAADVMGVAFGKQTASDG